MAKLIKHLIIGSSLMTGLIGCASKSVDGGYFENNGLTVNQIYKQAMIDSGKNGNDIKMKGSSNRVNYQGYTREALTENQNLFKTIKNPSVPIYVYPDIAQIGDEEILKPGYTTVFKLYKKEKHAFSWEKY